MKRIKEISESIFWFVTSPIWIVFVLIAFASLPKQFWKDYDEYLEAIE